MAAVLLLVAAVVHRSRGSRGAVGGGGGTAELATPFPRPTSPACRPLTLNPKPTLAPPCPLHLPPPADGTAGPHIPAAPSATHPTPPPLLPASRPQPRPQPPPPAARCAHGPQHTGTPRTTTTPLWQPTFHSCHHLRQSGRALGHGRRGRSTGRGRRRRHPRASQLPIPYAARDQGAGGWVGAWVGAGEGNNSAHPRRCMGNCRICGA